MPKVQQSQSFFSLRNLSRMFTNQRILLGYDRVITTEGLWVHPHDVTKEMEQLVHQNLLLLREFEDHLCDFCKQYVDGGSVKDVLLDHFEDILGKVCIMTHVVARLFALPYSQGFGVSTVNAGRSVLIEIFNALNSLELKSLEEPIYLFEHFFKKPTEYLTLDKFEVFYIDYENQEVVAYSQLRPLDSSVSSSPGLAQLCSLAYVKVLGLEEDYGHEAGIRLSEHTLNGPKEFTAVIMERYTSGGKVKG